MTARLPITLDANTRTISAHPPDTVPALIAAAGERARRRFPETPCRADHNLEAYLIAYIEGAGLAEDPEGPRFRATGITAYLTNGGTLEKAAQMANHVST